MKKDIAQEILDHPDNRAFREKGYRPIYVAHPDARILIIGQAPGLKTQNLGVPFHDASGNTLMQWMGIGEEVFRDPSKVSVLPMDFFYPGKGKSGDLPPRKGFADQWHPRFLAEMKEVKLIILAGRYAQEHYLKDKKNLTESVRHAEEYFPYFPIPHPSPLNFRWQAKNPWFAEEILPLLKQKVAEALK